MRRLGTLQDEGQARLFAAHLTATGIVCEVRPGETGQDIWIIEDGDRERAQAELAAFRADPGAPRYRESQATARVVEEERARDLEDRRQKYIDVRTSWYTRATETPGLTSTLIFICIMVAALTALGEDQERFLPRLTFRLRAIQHGQFWRLITPIFLHFGIFHLLFNLYWLRDNGGLIEREKGALLLGLLVLWTGIPSNAAQYCMSGPAFGGFSGVGYGFFGYLWMKGRYEPRGPLQVSEQTVREAILWLLLCMTGAVGPIANTAHVVGMGMGMLAGGSGHHYRKLRSWLASRPS